MFTLKRAHALVRRTGRAGRLPGEATTRAWHCLVYLAKVGDMPCVCTRYALQVSQEQYAQNLKSMQEKVLNDQIEFLCSTGLYSPADRSEMSKMIFFFEQGKTVPRGTTIMSQGPQYGRWSECDNATPSVQSLSVRLE